MIGATRVIQAALGLMPLDETRRLCRRPYAGHPSGCPNFGVREKCPPQAKHIMEVLDCSEAVWLVAKSYDLDAHEQRVRIAHPDWSVRQLRNPRHWQSLVMARLRQVSREVSKKFYGGSGVVVEIPEAHGVNVTATCAGVGINLEWPTDTTGFHLVWKVMLVGRPAPTSDFRLSG